MSKRGKAGYAPIRKRGKSDVMHLVNGAAVLGTAALFMSPTGAAQAVTMHGDQANALGRVGSSQADQASQTFPWLSQTTCGLVGPQGPQGGSEQAWFFWNCGPGPQGPQGSRGARGPQGRSGGHRGPTGYRGPNGHRGAQGYLGAQGFRGPTGFNGLPGA
jgi:Collagen triple helix repeat (20 copies)